MGILAPLYFIGILAVGIPILLHLIKRTPQGRQFFSSLMFLSPSPPRLTRRSRLSNILLLLLRALAITLLAIAFARPFFHWNSSQDRQLSSGRRIIFLVDTSASMQRPDLWNDAVALVNEQLKTVDPADEVGLYFFDRQMRPALTMSQWNESGPGLRKQLLVAALAQGKPTWSGTRLGDALTAAADLASENNSAAHDLKRAREIVLVSDLQEGSKLETLMGPEWPKDVSVREIKTRLIPRRPDNASIQWVEAVKEQPATSGPAAPVAQAALTQADGTLRVRVLNQADSKVESFALAWHNDKGAVSADPPIQVYVPPGQSQIVKVTLPPDGARADRLVLAGDNCDFDNTLYVVPPQVETLRVLYVGDDGAEDVNAFRYYFTNALLSTTLRKLELIARPGAEPVTQADVAGIRLAVVTRAPADAEIALLKKHMESGGDVVWVGKDVDTCKRSETLMGLALEVSEAGGDYALLSRVELNDPLFAPFHARTANFSKIHFWKHRQVKWDVAHHEAPHVLARFDDGTPYLIARKPGAGVSPTPPSAAIAPGAKPIASGTCYLLTSGWHPTDSELGNRFGGTFVTIVEQWVLRKDALAIGAQYFVDDSIPLPPGASEVASPGGKTTQLAGRTSFTEASLPGIYRIKAGGQEIPVAVNLSPEESRTTPRLLEDLQQFGVVFSSEQTEKIAADRQRTLLNNELENKQKTWRWILLTVLGLLAVETALAGRLSRSASLERAAT